MELARRAAVNAAAATTTGATSSSSSVVVGGAALSATAPALAQLPSTAIVAAQPYATLGGYGLSLNFAEHEKSAVATSSSASTSPLPLRALHALPFSNAVVPSAYQHIAFEALMAFCTAERPDGKGVPLPNVWERVGDIGTCYASMGYSNNNSANGGVAGLPQNIRRLKVLKERSDAIKKGASSPSNAAAADRRPFPSPHVPAAHPTLAGIELVSSGKASIPSSSSASSSGNGKDLSIAKAAGKALDVKVSLYSADHNAVFTALMTGRGGGGGGGASNAPVAVPDGEAEAAGDFMTSGSGGNAAAEDDRTRFARQDFDQFSNINNNNTNSSSNNNGDDNTSSSSVNPFSKSSGWFVKDSMAVRSGPRLSTMEGVEDGLLTRSSSTVTPPSLLFELQTGNNASNGGKGSSAAAGEVAKRKYISQLASVPSFALTGSHSSSAAAAAASPIPPWFLLAMLSEFADNIVTAQQRQFGKYLVSSSSSSSSAAAMGLDAAASPALLRAAHATASLLFSPEIILPSYAASSSTCGATSAVTPPLSLVAHNSTLSSDIFTDRPIEFICSTPKYFPMYHMAPWQHRLGLPQLRGEECIAMYAEVWQDGERRMRGNFFFTA